MGVMKHDLEVRHGRALIAVAEAGSIGGAARALGMAQSTLSETLLSLERLLGFSVTLRRSGQVAKLTAAAEALLPYARTLVAASERAMSIGTTGTLPTTIRLGTVEFDQLIHSSAPVKQVSPALADHRRADHDWCLQGSLCAVAARASGCRNYHGRVQP